MCGHTDPAHTTCGAVAMTAAFLYKVREELRPHTVQCAGAGGGAAALRVHSVGFSPQAFSVKYSKSDETNRKSYVHEWNASGGFSK